MVAKVLFALLRYEITGEEVSEEIKGLIDHDMLLDLHKISSAHDLGHLIGDALLKLGITDEGAKDAFNKQKIFAIYRSQSTEIHIQNIKSVLESAEIDYILLKGAFIRNLYPEQWMRTSGDIDVLVREEDLEKAIESLKNNGWETDGKKNYHDVSLYYKGKMNLELHFSIKENMKNLDSVLERVWDFAYLKDGHEFVLSDEFLLFYLFAHIAYHFVKGGCGIRTVLDIWLLKENLETDEKIFKNLCKEAQIDVFADRVAELSETWFGERLHTDITKKMEEFILFGGVYGNSLNLVKVNQAEAGGRNRNILKRIFMPYDKMIIRYPFLNKHKCLTPIFWIVRGVEMMFKGRLKYSVREFNLASQTTTEETKNTKEFLKDLGLM